MYSSAQKKWWFFELSTNIRLSTPNMWPCQPLCLSTQTTTNRGSHEGLARLHQTCMHTLHFFFLSWSAMLIPALYLRCVSINRDIGIFAAKFGADQMFGCLVKCIRISAVRTQQTRRSATFTGSLDRMSNNLLFWHMGGWVVIKNPKTL